MNPERPSHDKTSAMGQLSRLSTFSIRYPVTICMVLLSFLVLGGVSMTKIPLVLFPNIDEPFISVRVPYPNATPEQIQQTIVKPLEEALGTIANIRRLQSNATSDSAWVGMAFEWGEDIQYLRSEVRAKAEQVRKDLPQDVDRILVESFNTNDIPIIQGRISSGRDLRGAYDFLDLKIKKPLEQVSGVAEVAISGVERRQVEINLRLDDIKLYQVDVGALFQKLDGANLNMSLGQVNDGGYRYQVITDGAVDSLERLRNFPVNALGLKLRDVAEVEFREPRVDFGRHLNGEYAISLEIKKASDANTVRTVDRVMERIARLNQDPSLQGIEVLVWHNSGKEITKSLSDLLNAGLLGALLAIVVLFLFLRNLKATLIIGFSIPFSIVAAVGFIYLMGDSLNVLSMMGLMLSTGMLVDNAVVVMESIFRRLELGDDRPTASRTGTREVVMAVVASTLTSIIIFVPLVFGKRTNLSIFLGHTGIAIMITLLCSLFISLTLIPLAVTHFIQIDVNRRWPGWARVGGWFGSLRQRRSDPAADPKAAGNWIERYLKAMKWTLNHRPIVVSVSLVALAVSLGAFSKLPDSSPEAEELRDVSIAYEFSENYHYAKIEADFVNPVESYLFSNRQRFKIRDIYSYYGNNEAETRLYFDTDQLSPGELTQIRKEISEGLPVIAGAEIRLGGQEGGQNEHWISVNILGEAPAQLQELAGEARRRLLQDPTFAEVHTALDRGQEEVQITLDREKAKKYGVSPQSVAGVLGVIVRGRRIRSYRTPEGEVEIWVKLRPDDREDLNDLKSVIVGRGPNGQGLPISQVADFKIARTPGSIRRENRQTYTGIYTNYSGDKREEGIEKVTAVMNDLRYPFGYSWSYGFWTLRRGQENRDFIFNLLLALFMVYFVMASLFESLTHPLAIMLSLLFAFVGVTWFLMITGTPFNIMAMIGVMILIGIVVNNGIVLIDHVNNLRREGQPRTEAVLTACRDRFRPILMTATTTIVGLLPLGIGTASLFELRYFPMARTIMGGLMASTLLTLIVLPTVYTLLDDLGIALRKIWRAGGPRRLTTTGSIEAS